MHETHNPGPGRGGFTLIELIVAIGAVVLLSVGIGQVFTQVQRLVGTGSAVADVDQLARSIERQMREDFDALRRTPQDETMLAIRSRRVGDISTPLFLTADDREFESRNEISPYAQPPDPRSRALTVRLDEILFLGTAREVGGFRTKQQTGEDGPVAVDVARIYYGHGLRPQIDENYDPSEPLSEDNYPVRQLVPDGVGVTGGVWGDAFGLRFSRNEFAGDFMLLRHELLLASGDVACAPGGDGFTSIGVDREYAVLIRDQQAAERLLLFDNPDTQPPPGARNAQPTLLRHGRTDICAQGPQEVRRWLEGRADPGPTAADAAYPDATALTGGCFDGYIASGPPSPNPDSPLWVRPNIASAINGTALRARTRRGLLTAIAGCFNRYLAESEPPVILRQDTSDTGLAQLVAQPENAAMDLHAVIASRCSSFEVAWSDGTIWEESDDLLDLNDELRARPGDIVWFDLDLTRRDFWDANPAYRQQVPNDPEIRPQERSGLLYLASGPVTYDADATGGATEEYMAIWGFREPDLSGGYSSTAWRKPELIRVRMTLHDRQFRLDGGKQYEFIFSLDPT